MRRRNISILIAAGPAVNALSLANFQSITSGVVPLTCLLTYDSQIPSCTTSDFKSGCSASCISALSSVAQSVSDACSNVQLSSNSLLAIIQDGGIVEALCPAVAKTSATETKSQKPVTISSSTPAVSVAASVTIPTDGPGVTGGLGFKTSITSTSSSTSISQAQSASTTTMSTPAATSSTSETSQLQSNDGGLGGRTTSTSTNTASKKTSTTSSKTTSSPESQSQDGKSGGGSPFDIASNDASHDVGRSMMALVVAICAVLVIRR